MKAHKLLGLLVLLFVLPSLCFAQETQETKKSPEENTSKEVKKPQEEKKPTFVSSKFEASLYGFIKADLIYDDSQTFWGNVSFWANSEPAGSDNQFNFTMNQTRFGLAVKGPQVLSGMPKGVLEIDFYGSAAEGGTKEYVPNLRLYRAFVEIKWPTLYILLGQDWDTHSTLYPTSLNFGYLTTAGNTMYRRPQLRVVKFFPFTEKAKLSLAGALARTIATDLDGNGENDGDDAGFPTLEGRLAYEHKFFDNLPFTIAASGHYGKEEIDWTGPGGNFKVSSWSIVGEFIVPFWQYAYLKGEYFLGSNLDAYWGGILQGVNTTTRDAIKSTGGWAELTLMPIKKKLAFHLGGGTERVFRDEITDGSRLQNVITFANTYYNITENLIAAFQYSYYKTLYKNAANGDDNRFHTSFIYTF